MLININSELFALGSINSESRLVLKKKGIYHETEKPNIFVRTWRRLTGQYNQSKIALKAVELYANSERISSIFNESVLNNTSSRMINRYLDNLDAVVEQIPEKNGKFERLYNDLHDRIEYFRTWRLQTIVTTDLNDDSIIVSLNRKRNPEEALQVLDSLVSAIPEGGATSIVILQRGSPEIDQGGPSRQFMSSLFEDLISSEATQKYFTKKANIPVPCFNNDDFNQMFFEHLGRFMALASRTEKPVGEFIDRNTLNVIYEMNQDDFFTNSLISYDFNDAEILNKFTPFYNRLSDVTYNELVEKYADYLVDPQSLDENELHKLYNNIQEFYLEDIDPDLNREEIIAVIREAQQEMREDAGNLVRRKMLAVLSIMDGMRHGMNLDEDGLNGDNLAARVLGESVTSDTLLGQLQFQNVPQEKTVWVQNWIGTRSPEEIKKFLAAVTGSKGLQPTAQISISQCNEYGDKVKFATCSKTLMMDFSQVNDEDTLHAALSGAISFADDFNIR